MSPGWEFSDKIYIPLPVAILDVGPWRQMYPGVGPAPRCFFMSRVPLTQFRLFRTECFIRVQGLTATPGLTWPQDEIRTKIEKKTFARWIIYNSQLLAQMKLENAILSLKLTLILT